MDTLTTAVGNEISSFTQIAPYLRDPLVLIGFFLFLGFLVIRIVLGKIPPQKQNQGFKIIRSILLYGFILGLVLMLLGFGLKYREMSKEEQRNVINQLKTELDGNYNTLSSIKLNTETCLSTVLEVTKSLRNPGIKIVAILFPEKNLITSDTTLNSFTLVRNAYQELADKKYDNNKSELKKLDLFASAISSTIEKTKPTILSLSDSDHKRFKIRMDSWNSNLPILRKVNEIDVTDFQKTYSDLDKVRSDYDVISQNCINYLNSISNYFGSSKQFTQENLSIILSLERQFYRLIETYSKEIIESLEKLIAQRKKIDFVLSKID